MTVSYPSLTHHFKKKVTEQAQLREKIKMHTASLGRVKPNRVPYCTTCWDKGINVAKTANLITNLIYYFILKTYRYTNTYTTFSLEELLHSLCIPYSDMQ